MHAQQVAVYRHSNLLYACTAGCCMHARQVAVCMHGRLLYACMAGCCMHATSLRTYLAAAQVLGTTA